MCWDLRSDESIEEFSVTWAVASSNPSHLETRQTRYLFVHVIQVQAVFPASRRLHGSHCLGVSALQPATWRFVLGG